MAKETTKQNVSRRKFLGQAGTAIATTSLAGAVAGVAVARATGQPAELAPALQGAVKVTLKVNGKTHTLDLQPRVTLLDALRERLQITGAKRICDRGTCGGCTVLKDGKPIYGCMMLAVDAQNCEITTVEGLGTPEKMSELQKQFVLHDGMMCGFCTPGFVVATHAAISNNRGATMEQIKEGCRGNICRCGTFNRVFEAAYDAARKLEEV